ncbi:MAG: sulfatase [Lachnospiraceae bacterium]
MKAIMVMYDSLCRKYLQPYGCDWTITPNFQRLAQRCVQFENSYVCSMPCMPARRELHTGRPNFLHRSWGPLEPFDDSMPEILKRNGIYTHLVSDHQHYWEDGGCTYHSRYSSWELSRGQEGDRWQADLHVNADHLQSVFKGQQATFDDPKMGAFYRDWMSADQRNRQYMDTEEKTCQAVTFAKGLEFLRENHDADNWFLQIETFDPHEPFYCLPQDREKYPALRENRYGDALDDWPPYSKVEEGPDLVEHTREVYAALVTKCDRYLGKVLDLMDAYHLWDDTLLIVNTDHGLLLGEHGWWGKTTMPIYEEIAHTPLFVYDPRRKGLGGVKRYSIVQTIDLAPTLLNYFGVAVPKDMLGKPIFGVMDDDTPIRQYAVFGYHGSQIDITDGRYVYMQAVEHPEIPNYEYTLMPTHMRMMFFTQELEKATLAAPFSFTKGCPVLKIPPLLRMGDTNSFGSHLYDLSLDPEEDREIQDPAVVGRMKQEIGRFMDENDAPAELYDRYGIQTKKAKTAR